MAKTAALILAAGLGSRMGGVSKAKLEIGGTPAVTLAALAFENAKLCDVIIVAAKPDEKEWIEAELKKSGISKLYSVVIGGATRQKSAQSAFSAVPEDCDFVAIHDGARCLITAENADAVIAEAFLHNAACAAYKVTDTLKSADGDFILDTVDREKIWAVQTPQVFSKKLYAEALAYNEKSGGDYTDDCALCEKFGAKIKLVDIGKNNIKLTTKADIETASTLLNKGNKTMIRTGHGYDAHRFAEGRKLVLGGVDIPYSLGLDGHSDADVLCHAVMDALLGAAALGDIGKHFPPSDDEYLGISSITLLERTRDILIKNGYSFANIDATVIAQNPKLSPYIEKMRENIAAALCVDKDAVSVKATTEEKMGFTGRMEGISAHCVCLITK